MSGDDYFPDLGCRNSGTKCRRVARFQQIFCHIVWAGEVFLSRAFTIKEQMPAQTAVFLAVQIEISANHDINGPYGLENNHSQSFNTELSGLIDFIVI